ncbi:hypothetical protein HDU98_011861 [Podochytrium sp. JEL0797]|nr:hypothetical protein HDU98_011861 [Podochytrium sp. JEL0797]
MSGPSAPRTPLDGSEYFHDTAGPLSPLVPLRIAIPKAALLLPANTPPLVAQWGRAHALQWLNTLVVPLLAAPSNQNTPLSAAKPPLSAHDLALLDSVFNIGELPKDKKKAVPLLQVKDLNRANIKNGGDLLLANDATVKDLFKKHPLSEQQRDLVLDAVKNLRQYNDAQRMNTVLARQAKFTAANNPPENPYSGQSNAAAQYSVTHPHLDAAGRSSLDISKLVINRAPRPLDLASNSDRNYSTDIDRNLFTNVMNPAASKIWEKCVKVYLIGLGDKLTWMIDVSEASNGAEMRAKILSHAKFRLSDDTIRKLAIYAANDAAGSYDDDRPLDDMALFQISTASDINLRHLTLAISNPNANLKSLSSLPSTNPPPIPTVNDAASLKLHGDAVASDPWTLTSNTHTSQVHPQSQNPDLYPNPAPQPFPATSPTSPTFSQRTSFYDYPFLHRVPSTTTFNDTLSITSSFPSHRRPFPRGGTGPSLFSIASKAFPDGRPAVETIAQNLELYFPQMQPLDTSDALQGVVWYDERDVAGSVYEGTGGVTRVTSIRKADVASVSGSGASVYNGSIMSRRSRQTRAGSVSGVSSSLGRTAGAIPVRVPPSPSLLTVAGSAAGKRVGFRDRLARLGNGGLFTTRESSSSVHQQQERHQQQVQNVSKKMSLQDLVSNLAQVGLLERKPPPPPNSANSQPHSASSSSSAAAKMSPGGAFASPDRMRESVDLASPVESIRRNLTMLVEGDIGELMVEEEEEEGEEGEEVQQHEYPAPGSAVTEDGSEALVVAVDGSEVDVYNSFSLHGDGASGASGEGIPKPSEESSNETEDLPLHIQWKGFVFKPNPSAKSPSGSPSKRPSSSTTPSNPSTMVAPSGSDGNTIHGSTTGTMMSVDQEVPSSVTEMPGTLMPTTIPSEQHAPPPRAGRDTDEPSLFTDDDISAPTQSHIRWMKGDKIGQGSFGRVFYGVNLNTSEVMAVKQIDVVPISRYRNKVEAEKNRQKMIESLRTEILLLNELCHENVVRYLGFDIESTLVSVFLEYVSGGSVASMISRFGPFEEPLSQCILTQILTGLEYLHDRSIIHRDIKGGNILVNMDGTVKISDFGISKKNELDLAYQLNANMDFAGSVSWMAPEMSRNQGYSAKIDVWAVGCVAVEMWTGKPPWAGKGHMQVMYELKQGNAPGVPVGVLGREAVEFVRHCFIVDPEDRPTASMVLEQCAFVQVDPLHFDFEQWWEVKEEQYQLQCLDNTSSMYSMDD